MGPEIPSRELASARRLLALRLVHGAFAGFFVACIGLVFYAGWTGEAMEWAFWAVGALLIEGALVAASGGDCPLAPLHRRYGDDKGFFGLFLPRSWLPGVIPVLAVVAGLGIALLVARAW